MSRVQDTQGETPGLLRKLAGLLVAPRQGSQGRHSDPDLEPEPDPRTWSADQRAAWFSDEMDVLRDCVSFRGESPRDSVLADLAEFHHETPAESRRKCIDWVELSIAEWKAADRSTPVGVQDFYDTCTSWRYDLGWYAYLQVTGHAFPQSVAVVRFLRARNRSDGDILDFGSGIGLNAQVFDRFGYRVTIADVSKPLLDYAIWRNARYGADIRAINLNHEPLPQIAFDVVTAFDVLVHVTDFDVTARQLHGAIRPGGWLIANFDTRVRDEASAWHLYDDEIDLDRRLKRAGFVKHHVIGGYFGCYQRVEPTTLVHQLRIVGDSIMLPVRQSESLAQRIRWPTPKRVAKAARRLLAPRPESAARRRRPEPH